MALLAGRFPSHFQMELLRGPVRVVTEDTLGQNFIVVSMTLREPFLFVTGEARLRNRELLEIPHLWCMTSLTFCLRRMCSVNLPS